MLGTLLVQLAAIAGRGDLEAILCRKVVTFMSALVGVVPYTPAIDFGSEHKEINGTGMIYFAPNLRIPQNCTVDYPSKGSKTISLLLVEDMIIFLDNGKWIGLKDCELAVQIAVTKEGTDVSMRTRLLEVAKVENVTLDDAPDSNPADRAILKKGLQRTLGSLCDQYLSSNFSHSGLGINQAMAFTLFQQVYQIFLSVV